MRRSEFPRESVLPHIDYARRIPLRAVGLFTAVGIASALGYALGLAAAIGLGAAVSTTFARPDKAPLASAAEPVPAPSRFILNALLVPALDPDAVPPRWVDPRPRLRCERQAAVWVNGEPLRPGELVPSTPFEMEWMAQGCMPFGNAGPRFDGGVTLTVFPEDWGYSAMVKPFNLRVVQGGSHIPVQRGSAIYPQCIEAGDTKSCS